MMTRGVDVTFSEGGQWVSVNVTTNQLQSMLLTGMLGEYKICALKNLLIIGHNKDLVYDFQLLRMGKNPWRLYDLSTGEYE